MGQPALAIIAGSGQFPIAAAARAKAQGRYVFAVCHVHETDPAIERVVDGTVWLRVGQLGRLLSALKKSGATQAVFIGGISRVRLFRNTFPDLKLLSLIARIGSIRDDVFLRAVAAEVERSGISVIGSSELLPECIVSEGLLTKRALTPAERTDAVLGWDAAKALGAVDAGQTAVVSGGLVVALECVEGTDETISRAGRLTQGKSAVVVKTAKPQQDLRLDLPAIGLQTLETMKNARATALILEAGKAMILSPEDFIRRANELDVSVYVSSDRDTLKT